MRNAENYQEVCTKKKGVKSCLENVFKPTTNIIKLSTSKKLHQMRLMLVVAL